MKKTIIMCAVAAASTLFVGCTGNKAAKKPENFADSIAYYSGLSRGLGLAQAIQSGEAKLPNGELVDVDQFLKGFKTALDVDSSNYSYLIGLSMGVQTNLNMTDRLQRGDIDFNKEMYFAQYARGVKADSVSMDVMMRYEGVTNELMNRLSLKIREKLMAEAAEKSKVAMEEAKKKYPAMKTTASGLGYVVNSQGEGTPTTTGRVKVIYTGRLIDGTVFDDSRGEAVEFDVNQVVPGFSEGLKMMAPGAKYTLIVPDNLGYNGHGPAGQGGLMVFDVEMVGPVEETAAK